MACQRLEALGAFGEALDAWEPLAAVGAAEAVGRVRELWELWELWELLELWEPRGAHGLQESRRALSTVGGKGEWTGVGRSKGRRSSPSEGAAAAQPHARRGTPTARTLHPPRLLAHPTCTVQARPPSSSPSVRAPSRWNVLHDGLKQQGQSVLGRLA